MFLSNTKPIYISEQAIKTSMVTPLLYCHLFHMAEYIYYYGATDIFRLNFYYCKLGVSTKTNKGEEKQKKMQDKGTTVESEQLSIDQYAVIGNMKTSCFVGIDGSIDWCCFPFFNSPSVFAKILDCEKGGYFSIKPNSIDYIPKQHYW
jgi:hypothetical protein